VVEHSASIDATRARQRSGSADFRIGRSAPTLAVLKSVRLPSAPIPLRHLFHAEPGADRQFCAVRPVRRIVGIR
jgi:hypothetical protein